MNYFKAAEQILYSAPVLVQAKINLDRRKARLAGKDCPRDIGALDYGKPFVDATDANDTLNDLLEYGEVCRNLEETVAALEEIDNVLGQMDEERASLLRLWYIDRQAKEHIMDRLYIASLKTLYNLRNRSVAEFALLWFGAAALDSI